MFDTLLESRARRRRSTGGAAASVAAHATLIGGALVATAQVRVQAPEVRHAIRTIYFPPRAASPPTRPKVTPGESRAPLPGTISVVIPRLDLSAASSRLTSADLSSMVARLGTPPLLTVGSSGGSDTARPMQSSGVFQEHDVEKSVSLANGGVTPKYPEYCGRRESKAG